jgi:autotransporter-associated beta strand protein
LTALSPVTPGPLARGATGNALLRATKFLLYAYPMATAAAGMTTDAQASTATPPSDSGATWTIGNSAGASVQSGLGATGAGTIILAGASSYTGSTTINSGTIAVGTVGSPVAPNGGSLTVSGSLSGFSGVIAGSGAGTITLNSGNTYTGTTTISGGTLTLAGAGTLAGGSLLLNSGGTITIEPPIIIDPLPPIQPGGRILVHAHGLPPHVWVTIALDGTEIRKAFTDSAGNLNASAIQSASGKIPSDLDLFTVSTLTVQDDSGKVYLTASF